MLFRQLLGLLGFVSLVYSASGPIVDLGYAQYQGTVNTADNVTIFLGIRFAAPPVGDLRWSAPQAPESTTEVLPATAQPPACLSAGNGRASTSPFRDNTTFESRAVTAGPPEDCLFLNVFTPESVPSSAADLPVVVWIHGGGYISGSATGFNGQDLIRQSGRGVVAVIVQYRLGLFGFLSGQAIKAGGSLNVGLLDQEFALLWVQEHIAKFGGNKDKVTIWGESAGAGSVLQHVVARDGETNPPLFRAAITSSTFLPSQYLYNDTIPEKLFSDVVQRANCTSASDALACLRGTDVNLLQTTNTDINAAGFFGTFVFVPVVDGIFIVRRPVESMALGRVNGEALLTVTNANEGSIFVDANSAATTNAMMYAANLFPLITANQASEAARQYAVVGDTLAQITTIMAEAIFVCPTYYLLDAFPEKSFKGEFAIPPANHGQDVVYYFPNGGSPPFNNTLFINAFSQSFLDFAISLDPNVKTDPTNIAPEWNKYSGSMTEMLFNKTGVDEPLVQPITTSNAVLERCQFWRGLGAVTGQ